MASEPCNIRAPCQRMVRFGPGRPRDTLAKSQKGLLSVLASRMPNPSLVVTITPADDDNYFNIQSVAVAKDPKFKKYKNVGMDLKDNSGSLQIYYNDILNDGKKVQLMIDRVKLTAVLVMPEVFSGPVQLGRCSITKSEN